MRLIKKLRKAKKEAGPNSKPAMVKTHLRDMIIVPEMIGSVVGVYVSLRARRRPRRFVEAAGQILRKSSC
jgi:hypothetical protein